MIVCSYGHHQPVYVVPGSRIFGLVGERFFFLGKLSSVDAQEFFFSQ